MFIIKSAESGTDQFMETLSARIPSNLSFPHKQIVLEMSSFKWLLSWIFFSDHVFQACFRARFSLGYLEPT